MTLGMDCMDGAGHGADLAVKDASAELNVFTMARYPRDNLKSSYSAS